MMKIEMSRIKELTERPSESLSVEIKNWINPDEPINAIKIIKSALAIRNHGGGYIVIGFDNNTLEPDSNPPSEVRTLFHIDKIQALISKFASEPFEVLVEFPERDAQIYPVIIIPSGVKTPVATRSELRVDIHNFISTDTIYVRSLNSNNTPSTTRANWKDWNKIVEICFENREADIGRFLRRHLSGLTPDIIKELALKLSSVSEREDTSERIVKYLNECKDRFFSLTKERNISLPAFGTWEVALFLEGKIPEHAPNLDFLNLLDSTNPDYTGWPVWLDSRSFQDISARPYVFNGAWESLIKSLDSSWRDIDFMRLDPKGRFYLLRALQDDISGNERVKPLTELDFGLSIIRTAEAIAVGIAFAKAMGCSPEETTLAFAFKWSKLKGRQLSAWANPGRYISRGRIAHQDDILTIISVPLETSLSALGGYVHQVVRPLFELFDGFSISKDVIEDLTRQLIERKL